MDVILIWNSVILSGFDNFHVEIGFSLNCQYLYLFFYWDFSIFLLWEFFIYWKNWALWFELEIFFLDYSFSFDFICGGLFYVKVYLNFVGKLDSLSLLKNRKRIWERFSRYTFKVMKMKKERWPKITSKFLSLEIGSLESI